LQHLINLYNEEAVAKQVAKETQAALDLATLKKYGDRCPRSNSLRSMTSGMPRSQIT
jgi:hypothetical protein